jgi:hypothetical protein
MFAFDSLVLSSHSFLIILKFAVNQVASTGMITREDRARAWNDLQRAAKEKKTRPFYRAVNKYGLMFSGKQRSHSLVS